MPMVLQHLLYIIEYELSMRSILLVIFLIACYTIVSAQTTQLTDVELWLKAGGKIDLSERLRLSVEEQIRFDNDLADLKNFHTEIDLRYELTEQWDLHAVGRYMTRNDNQGENQGFEDRFRYQLGSSYSHKTGRWRFKHRLLYQNRNNLERTKGQGDVHRQFLRVRTNVEYKVKN